MNLFLYRLINNTIHFNNGNVTGNNTGSGGTIIWSTWDSLRDADFNTLIGKIGSFLYYMVIVASVLFAGIKLATALVNYFGTPNSQYQLKSQYKNDIKEVFVGFVMLFTGVEVIAQFINLLFPETNGIITTITSSLTSDSSGLFANISPQLGKIVPAINFLYWGIIAVGEIWFAIKAITNFINYYQADDEREKIEFKNNAKNALFGMCVLLMSGTILGKLLGIFGIGQLVNGLNF